MPRHNGKKRHKRKCTNNLAFAAAKAASDAAVKSTGVNPTPVGRPPTQEADPELLSPTEKRAAAMGSGEDAGLIWAAKRMRPAYSDGAAAERSPLQYVTVAEAEVRTAIKVCYVRTLGAPPES